MSDLDKFGGMLSYAMLWWIAFFILRIDPTEHFSVLKEISDFKILYLCMVLFIATVINCMFLEQDLKNE